MDGADLPRTDDVALLQPATATPPRLGLLSNPNSGTGRARDRLAQVARDVGVPHVTTRQASELEEALDALAKAGTTLLAVDGGDGTLQAVLSVMRQRRLFPREPVIALLRGGTTNMVHRDLGLAGRPDHTFRRLLTLRGRALPASAVVSRRPLALRRAGDASAGQLGFFFGAGAIPRAIRHARAHLHPLGLTGPVGEAIGLGRVMLRLLRKRVSDDPVLKPAQLISTMDRADWQQRQLVFAIATTLDRLILGLRPVRPNGGVGVLTLEWPYRGLVRALPSFITGRPVANDVEGISTLQATTITVAPRTPYVLDGELAEVDQELTITAAEPARFLRL